MRRAEAERRLLAVFARYPGIAFPAGDLSRMAWVRIGRTFPILWAWDDDGTISSGWAPGPEPRRRVYWLTADRRIHPPVVEPLDRNL